MNKKVATIRKSGNKLYFDQLRQKAVDQLKNNPSESNSQLTEEEIHSLVHEFEVRQIELELQNEEYQQVLEKLRESDEKHRQLIENSNDIIFTSTLDGVYTFVSSAWTVIMGHPVTEVVGQSFQKFVHPDDITGCLEFMQKLAEEGQQPLSVEYRARHMNGTWLLHQTIAKLIKDKTGTVIGFEGIARDITERERAKDSIRENNLRLDLAMKSANMAWWEMDIVTGEINFDKRKAEMLGFPPEKFKYYKDFMDLVHPEDYNKAEKVMKGHLEGLIENYDIEYRILTQSGEYKWFHNIGSVVKKDSNGKPLYITGILNDITNSKLADIDKAENEEKYRYLFQTMAQGVVYYNSDGFIIDANSSALKMLGLTFDQMIGHTIKNSEWKMIYEDGSDFPTENHPTIVALRTGKPAQAIMGIFIPVLKKITWLNVNAIPQKRADEKDPYQVFVTLHDISIEIELHRTQKELNSEIIFRSLDLEKGMKERITEVIQLSNINSAIVNNMGLALMTTSADGTIKSFNSEAEKLLGYNSDEVVGNTSLVMFLKPEEIYKEAVLLTGKPEEHIESDFEVFKIVIETLQGAPKEWTFLSKDGKEIVVLLSVTQMNNSEGDITGYIGVALDITLRKKGEEALHWNESFLKLMSSSSPMGLLVVDNYTDKILYLNHMFCEIWGITSIEEKMKSGELLNNDIIPYCIPVLKEVEAFANSCIPLQDPENHIVIEDEIPFNDGRTIRRFSTQIRGNNDEYYGRFYIFENITERKQTEVKLKMQNAAFESFALAIVITNIKAEIQWVNPAFTTLTGYSPGELIGQNASILQSGKMQKEYFSELWRTILSGNTWTGELINKRKDGSLYYEEETITPLFNEAGEVSRFIAIKIDISHRKEIEKSLRDNVEKEKELNDMKSRFVSTASHEFRTPLASILITSDSLINYWKKMEEAQIKDKLTKINNQVFHLTKIVNDVLQISRIEEGKVEFNPSAIDIIELCTQAIETFNSDPSLKNKVKLESPYRAVNMNLDTRLIIQVINNLVSNGIKYSPEDPKVEVEISMQKGELYISVSDKGIGIPEPDQKHLFTPFYRASNTRSIQGTGLGLNIVRESLRMHGGDITFTSKQGKGTKFVIHFPSALIINYE